MNSLSNLYNSYPSPRCPNPCVLILSPSTLFTSAFSFNTSPARRYIFDADISVGINSLNVRPKNPTTPTQNIQNAPVLAVCLIGSITFVDGGGLEFVGNGVGDVSPPFVQNVLDFFWFLVNFLKII